MYYLLYQETDSTKIFKIMNRYRILLLLFMLTATYGYSQKRITIQVASKYMSKVCDITYKEPK